MGKALLLNGSSATAAGTGSRDFPFAQAKLGSISPEAISQFKSHVAGTLSGMAALADNVGTSRTLRLRKNGADGNQIVTMTDTTAGLYADGSHTDAVADNDLISIRTAISTSASLVNWTRLIFAATTGHACFYTATGSSPVWSNNNVTVYHPIAGDSNGPVTTEALVQAPIRAGGTLTNGQIQVSANARTTATTLRSRVNGSYGTISIAIGTGLTGLFEDSTHSDTVVSGDLVNWAFDMGASAENITLKLIGCAITNTIGINDIFCASSNQVKTRAASGTPSYYLIAAILDAMASEAAAKVQHGFAVVTRCLRMNISANTYSGSATVTLRRNGAAASQTMTIGAGLTGTFEDAVGTDYFAPTDDADIEIVGGTSGSITIRSIGLTEGEPTAARVRAVVIA